VCVVCVVCVVLCCVLCVVCCVLCVVCCCGCCGCCVLLWLLWFCNFWREFAPPKCPILRDASSQTPATEMHDPLQSTIVPRLCRTSEGVMSNVEGCLEPNAHHGDARTSKVHDSSAPVQKIRGGCMAIGGGEEDPGGDNRPVVFFHSLRSAYAQTSASGLKTQLP
jgi:hypothetical protein